LGRWLATVMAILTEDVSEYLLDRVWDVRWGGATLGSPTDVGMWEIETEPASANPSMATASGQQMDVCWAEPMAQTWVRRLEWPTGSVSVVWSAFE
jgi:hypothetical protein